MSLVAYASSDSEEEAEVTYVPEPSSIPLVLPKTGKESETGKEKLEKKTGNEKPEKKVKITIPSLEQFKEEEGDSKPIEKPKPKFQSGSGLFGLLPPPKNFPSSTTQSFKPHILTKKKENKEIPLGSKHFLQKNQIQGVKNSSFSSSNSELTEDDVSSKDADDSAVPIVDYFSLDSSLDKNISVPEVVSSTDSRASSTLFSSLPEPAQSAGLYDASTSQQEVSSSSVTNPDELSDDANIYSRQSWDENYPSSSSSSSVPMSILEDERFKKLKGRHKFEDINIIDVKADDQLTNKNEWLMQSLTEEKVQRPSKRRQDMPTQQQKRKHQITYLAHQAKERELDLKNQWALNSRTRRETQAKYGF